MPCNCGDGGIFPPCLCEDKENCTCDSCTC